MMRVLGWSDHPFFSNPALNIGRGILRRPFRGPKSSHLAMRICENQHYFGWVRSIGGPKLDNVRKIPPAFCGAVFRGLCPSGGACGGVGCWHWCRVLAMVRLVAAFLDNCDTQFHASTRCRCSHRIQCEKQGRAFSDADFRFDRNEHPGESSMKRRAGRL